MNTLLLPQDARQRLSNNLIALRAERPKNVPPHVWSKILHGRAGSIRFDHLGELVDCYGPRVLEWLRWPEIDDPYLTAARR